ncbi:MAG TPA: hypothetical protein VI072_34885 [Polyangiaceae bacterium]
MRLAWWTFPLLAACASQPARVERPPALPESTASSLARVTAIRQRLIDHLRSLPDEGPIAEALDERTRAVLYASTSSLAESEKAEALSTRPLLHVLSGGASESAWLFLATSDSAVREILQVSPRAAARSPGLLKEVQSVARRAASAWLRAQVQAVHRASKFDTSVLERVDSAAETLARPDIQLTTRQLITEIHASAQSFLAFASSLARAGEVAAAREALRRARAQTSARDFAEEFALTERVLDGLETIDKNGVGSSRGDRLAVARPLARFGLGDPARALLARDAADAGKDLAVATSLALAGVDGDVCPGVPPAVRHPVLCDLAWSSSAELSRALEQVKRAWRAGGGRDRAAIVDYLGLVQVVPWEYAQARRRRDGEREFEAHLVTLERTLNEVRQSAAEFEALTTFVRVLRAGFESMTARGRGERAALPAALQAELWERARALGASAHAELWSRRAILAVAALLVQDRDVEPLLALLPQELTFSEAIARGRLRRWLAVARRDPALFTRAETELTDLLLKHHAPAEERARVVLFLAESSVALSRTPKSLDVLYRIAEQLVRRGGPEALRLRAAIDVAAVSNRRGRPQHAQRLLASTLADIETAAGARSEGDLFALARAYGVVLGAQAGGLRELKTAQRELLAPAGSNVVGVWRNLWREEFSTRERELRCGALALCKKQQRAAFQKRAQRLVADVNPLVARMLPRALAASSLSLVLQYAPITGLTPTVSFDPALLSVESPVW